MLEEPHPRPYSHVLALSQLESAEEDTLNLVRHWLTYGSKESVNNRGDALDSTHATPLYVLLCKAAKGHKRAIELSHVLLSRPDVDVNAQVVTLDGRSMWPIHQVLLAIAASQPGALELAHALLSRKDVDVNTPVVTSDGLEGHPLAELVAVLHRTPQRDRRPLLQLMVLFHARGAVWAGDRGVSPRIPTQSLPSLQISGIPPPPQLLPQHLFTPSPSPSGPSPLPPFPLAAPTPPISGIPPPPQLLPQHLFTPSPSPSPLPPFPLAAPTPPISGIPPPPQLLPQHVFAPSPSAFSLPPFAPSPSAFSLAPTTPAITPQRSQPLGEAADPTFFVATPMLTPNLACLLVLTAALVAAALGVLLRLLLKRLGGLWQCARERDGGVAAPRRAKRRKERQARAPCVGAPVSKGGESIGGPRGASAHAPQNLVGSTTAAEEGTNACVVCMDESASHAFTPCGHLAACSDCSRRILLQVTPACPLCRVDVREAVRIYGAVAQVARCEDVSTTVASSTDPSLLLSRQVLPHVLMAMLAIPGLCVLPSLLGAGVLLAASQPCVLLVQALLVPLRGDTALVPAILRVAYYVLFFGWLGQLALHTVVLLDALPGVTGEVTMPSAAAQWGVAAGGGRVVQWLDVSRSAIMCVVVLAHAHMLRKGRIGSWAACRNVAASAPAVTFACIVVHAGCEIATGVATATYYTPNRLPLVATVLRMFSSTVTALGTMEATRDGLCRALHALQQQVSRWSHRGGLGHGWDATCATTIVAAKRDGTRG